MGWIVGAAVGRSVGTVGMTVGKDVGSVVVGDRVGLNVSPMIAVPTLSMLKLSGSAFPTSCSASSSRFLKRSCPESDCCS